MDNQDFATIIRLCRRAPLHNMEEAEFVAKLLQRFAEHAESQPYAMGPPNSVPDCDEGDDE